MKKSKLYNPEKHKLEGTWLVTYKIDGVQVIYKDGVPKSRSGKKLYNLPDMEDGIYECFLGDWKSTISAVRTHNGSMVHPSSLYLFHPSVEERLLISEVINPTPSQIKGFFDSVRMMGYEGLMLHGPGGIIYKVKDKETYDVPITDIIEGTGRNAGRMGAVMTPMGKVGTGFKDREREYFWTFRASLKGSIVEVECMEVTEAGKFRHPRYIRLREDK